jgi:predicted GTPase
LLTTSIISENLKILEELLNKLPLAVVKNMKKEIAVVRELMVCQRAPRLMIVGRRGAGKSSLLNAVFGEKIASVGSVTSQTGTAAWYTCATSKGTVDLLDTRGLGDRTCPEFANYTCAITDINAAVDSSCPDAILFLCKAKEVDSRISDDLRNVKDIIDHIKTRHHYKPPVVGVVTQVDELDPLSDTNPPLIKN